MLDIYNYRKNITITTTPNGDKVITMNRQILVTLINSVSDAAHYQKNKGLDATSEDTLELWRALIEKEGA